MRWIRKWIPRRGEEADLKDELAAHLEIEKSQQRAAGMTPAEAERAARVAFGNLTSTREDVREAWGWAGIDRFLQDCRFGIRMLFRSPVWTAVVCLTLAMGIGISTAVFSVVHAVLLAPLPYPEPERVVAVSPVTAKSREPFRPNPSLWKYWRENLSGISDLALTRPVANFNFTGDGPPERLQGARITFNLPRVLGVQPMMGRSFTEAEQLGDAKVVLLSHGLWVRRFGGDAAIVGRKIQLNGEAHEVAGVMPAGFQYPDATFEIWSPLFLPAYDMGHGYNYGYFSVGRLKPGVTLDTVQAEMQGLMRRLAEEFPASYRAGDDWMGGLIEPLAKSEAAEMRPILLLLAAAVGCLLAIGCMNLAVLLFARASGRSRELLVRVALGATGERLRRQLLAEAVPLGLAGAAGGILLALWTLQLLRPLLPPSFPRIDAIGLNGAVLAFAIVCSLGVVIIASLLPSIQTSRVQLSGGLQRSSRGVAAGSGTRDFLVVGQVAVAMLLLFGGLLFGRSFAALLSVRPGFSGQAALTMHLAVPRTKFAKDQQVAAYYRRLEERIKTVPGVMDAGFINRLPLSGLAQTGGVEFEGKEVAPQVDWRSATPGYFGAMDIPLVRGRGLSDADRADGPQVGVIDTVLAKMVFGDENPVGKRFRRGGIPGQPNDQPWSEIVGVVGHVLNDSLEREGRPQAYWPETQRTQDRAALVVRTAGPPSSFASAVIAQIQQENPEQPVYDVRTMEDWMSRSMQTRTLTTSLVSLFGFASVALACLGLYGVIAYTTGLRLREFGIRMALGASGGEVRGIVYRKTGRMVGIGVAIGFMLCWPASQALQSFLFGIGSLDVVSWTLALGLLIGVGMLAGLGPAWRAAKADPAQTLRAE